MAVGAASRKVRGGRKGTRQLGCKQSLPGPIVWLAVGLGPTRGHSRGLVGQREGMVSLASVSCTWDAFCGTAVTHSTFSKYLWGYHVPNITLLA